MTASGSLWGDNLWGITPWGAGILDQEPGVDVVTATVFAADIIKLEFPEIMKNNANLQNVSTYTIVPVGSGISVSVNDVKPGNDGSVIEVYLIVSPFTVGAEYVVNIVTELLTIEGNALSVSSDIEFIGRLTKIDRIVRSRPPMYDMTPDSLLRTILNAIGHSDDLIGGSH